MKKSAMFLLAFTCVTGFYFACLPHGSYAQESVQIDSPQLVNGPMINDSIITLQPETAPGNTRFYNDTLTIKPSAAEAEANDEEQFSKIATLKRLSPETFSVSIDRGMVSKCEMDLKASALGLSASDGTERLSSAFFGQYSDFLRISNPSVNLLMMKRAGIAHETQIFRQYSRGVPVYGGWVETVIDNASSGQTASLTRAYGNYIPDLDLATSEPEISYGKAMSIVARKFDVAAGSFKTLVPTKLWIFDEALLAPRCPDCPDVPNDPHLAWRVIFASPRDYGAWADAFVDAATGDVLYYRPRIWNIDIDIETGNHDTSSTCWYFTTSDDAWFDEDGVCKYKWYCPFSSCCSNACADGWNCASPDQDGYDCYHFTWENYYFYKNVLGRNSYDGDGEEFEMYVHVGNNWKNANSVDCGLFSIHQFGDGAPTLDIVSHEVGHSFHRSEVGFTYQNESGAIAEHIADAFGTFVSHWSSTYNDPDWLHGEGSSIAGSCGAVRNLQNPPACGDPDRYSEYNSGSGDNGGVHTNSNILSKALYLMTVGGTHPDTPGLTIKAISEQKSRAIYHRVVTKKLPSTPSFINFRNFAVDACNEMRTTAELGVKTTSNDCCQMKNAFYACGLGNGDRDCDGIDDPSDPDRDNDGVSNSSDNCPDTPNGSQTDTDHDGQGNACDSDDDNDGVADGSDNCPVIYNPSQADSDHDGTGNACEDDDHDGVMDPWDNCPGTSNPTQSDIDHDGLGDACDSDMDGDSISNSADNCPKNYNNLQEDADGDGVGDICDNCPNISNRQTDIDHDGLGDACDSDMDGDGFDNEHDECPDEAGPVGGCPVTESIWNKIYGMMRRDPLIIPIGPCPQCGGNFIPATGDYIKMKFDVSLGFPAGFETEQPINLRLSIADETGRIVASGEKEFFSFKDSALADNSFELSFSPAPSYFSVRAMTAGTTRTSTAVRQFASFSDNALYFRNYGALPDYYLLIAAAPGDEKNAEILNTISFSITKTEETAGCSPGHPEDCNDAKACNRTGGAWCNGTCTAWEKCSGEQETLPVPDARNTFWYDPVVSPVLDSNASKCGPFAAGNLEAGTLNLQTGLPAFNGPVDIYFALQATPLNPFEIYFLVPAAGSGYNIVPYSAAGLQPWRTSTTAPVSQDFFGEIPLSALPSGPYTLYTLVTPAGNLESYYLWIDLFNVP